jgi:hypothetical protein
MKKTPPEAVLQIPPSMTKTEVREYLTKIYEIPVLKISTMNYLGIFISKYSLEFLIVLIIGRKMEKTLWQAQDHSIQTEKL